MRDVMCMYRSHHHVMQHDWPRQSNMMMKVCATFLKMLLHCSIYYILYYTCGWL